MNLDGTTPPSCSGVCTFTDGQTCKTYVISATTGGIDGNGICDTGTPNIAFSQSVDGAVPTSYPAPPIVGAVDDTVTFICVAGQLTVIYYDGTESTVIDPDVSAVACS